ncbi:MAG: hypothetical protein JWR80_53 [Bradyrhizobium sp.]|nr:hypothetical protein [Bradyrhizobium sp.]
MAIVTERWDGMRWTQRHRKRERIAGRDKLRERSSGRADERGRSVRQKRVDPTPLWLASSLAEALTARPGRGAGFREATEATKALILRGERVISRQAIAQGMSDVLRCPVCSCAHLLVHFAHETAGAARIRHSLLPHFSRDNETQTSGASRREHAGMCLESCGFQHDREANDLTAARAVPPRSYRRPPSSRPRSPRHRCRTRYARAGASAPAGC